MYNLDNDLDKMWQFSSSLCLQVGSLVNVHPFIVLLQIASSASPGRGVTRLHCS